VFPLRIFPSIHRIPGKDGFQKPVIVKVRNTDVKIQIMRQKKNLTKDVKFHDDITQRNLGLMARLKNTEKVLTKLTNSSLKISPFFSG
jgi:hypothetical protein